MLMIMARYPPVLGSSKKRAKQLLPTHTYRCHNIVVACRMFSTEKGPNYTFGLILTENLVLHPGRQDYIVVQFDDMSNLYLYFRVFRVIICIPSASAESSMVNELTVYG
jgi:hypothetical protein